MQCVSSPLDVPALDIIAVKALSFFSKRSALSKGFCIPEDTIIYIYNVIDGNVIVLVVPGRFLVQSRV